MQKCNITIHTQEGGENAFVRAEAQIIRYAEKDVVSFLCEGDRETLEMESDGLKMTRKGECALQMTLKRGQTTTAEISYGQGRSVLPVRTERFFLSRSKRTVRAELTYILDEFVLHQKFNLKIIVHIEE